MNEIEKMYKLVEAEPYRICNSCVDDNGNKITSSKNCSFRNLCGNACDEPRYILSAEKQIKLLKLILKKREILDIGYIIEEDKYHCMHYERVFNSFEEALCADINYHWQDLTEAEKQQVKGILE